MQQIEAAVREDDRLPRFPPDAALLDQFRAL